MLELKYFSFAFKKMWSLDGVPSIQFCQTDLKISQESRITHHSNESDVHLKTNLVKINIWTRYLSLVKRIWNFSQKGYEIRWIIMSPNTQYPHKLSVFATSAVCQLPVGFPYVDYLRVCNTVLQRLLIQQVKKVLNSQRYGSTGAEDCSKQIVHKLLQSPLN